MPLVTIGVTTFNRRDYLRESLASLLAQTFRDYEIIVVDDGSTDGTDAMMAEEFPRLRYFRKPNGGDASAKNFAAEHADSRYLVYNDSDDLFFPDALDRLLRTLDNRPDACSYGQYVRIDARGHEEPTRLKLRRYPSGRILPELLRHVIVNNCGTLMPLEAFRRIGGYDAALRVGYDYRFALNLALTHEFFAVSGPVFKRRRHDSNLSSAGYDKILTLRRVVDDFCRAHAADAGLDPAEVHRRLADFDNKLAREARREGLDRALVRRHLSEALRHHFQWKTLYRRLTW